LEIVAYLKIIIESTCVIGEHILVMMNLANRWM